MNLFPELPETTSPYRALNSARARLDKALRLQEEADTDEGGFIAQEVREAETALAGEERRLLEACQSARS